MNSSLNPRLWCLPCTMMLGCLLLAMTSAAFCEDPPSLSVKEIEVFVEVNKRAGELRQASMERIIAQKEPLFGKGRGEKEAQFSETLTLLAAAAKEAEEQACKESNVPEHHYRATLVRLVAVKEYLEIKPLRDELSAEMKRLHDMSDKDIARQAEDSYQETKKWYADIEKRGVQEKEQKKQALLASLERPVQVKATADPAMQKRLLQLKTLRQERLNLLKDSRWANNKAAIEAEIAKLDKLIAKLEKKAGQPARSAEQAERRRRAAVEKQLQKLEASPNGYLDSLKTQVIDPLEVQKTSGALTDSVRKRNTSRIQELKQSLAKLDAKLAVPRLKQAALDAPNALQHLNREELLLLQDPLAEFGQIAGQGSL